MRGLIEKYGWKSIVGTAILGLAQLFRLSDDLAPYTPVADSLGIVLGGVGFRVAITKIGEKR